MSWLSEFLNGIKEIVSELTDPYFMAAVFALIAFSLSLAALVVGLVLAFK
jgi:hypothetical protein